MKPPKNITEITVTTTEICDAWNSIQKNGSKGLPTGGKAQSYHADGDWRADQKGSEWIGFNGKQMADALNHGVWPEGGSTLNFDGDREIFTPRVDVDPEQGDFMYEERYSDNPFCRWDSQPEARALKIRAEFTFDCSVKAEVLAAYNEWLLNAIDAAEAQGISPEVELTITVETPFKEDRAKEVYRIVIPVVQSGTLNDAVAWRAFLSNGAFRMLGFVAMGIAGTKLGRNTTGGLGYPTCSEWKADLSEDREVITIMTDGGARSFAPEKLNAVMTQAFE